LFCREINEEAVLGAKFYEIDKSMMEHLVQQSKTELESG